MAFHVVLPRRMSADELNALRPGGSRPRMGIAMIAHELGATLYAPGDQRAAGFDRIRSAIVGPKSMWALARHVAGQVNSDDVVFCGSETGGLQIAEACGVKSSKPKICLFAHNLNRPRGRFALKWFKVQQRVELLLACSNLQTRFLRSYLKAPKQQARSIWDHTDTRFFSPGPASVGKTRPLIVSVGLEQRDYRTLALATETLDVDVRISGFSEDAAVLKRTFPDAMPANMTRKFYSWLDLVQLYRDADVVVVSVHENRYAAGVQSLMETMACGRPVIVTATQGLATYLDNDAVVTVPPADAAAMRHAIVSALANPEPAEARATRGLALARSRHSIERYVSEIATHLRQLATA